MNRKLPLFGNWLDATRVLQVEVYRADYSRFPHYPTNGNDTHETRQNLVDYIDVMWGAAIHELIELHDETSWKPWQHDDPYVNRGAVVKEAVDALHFVANILAAVACTDEELSEAYLEKMAVNRERQERESGYFVQADGVKCRICRRALDDVKPSLQDVTICQSCAITEMLHA
jgi:hypothetical protein